MGGRDMEEGEETRTQAYTGVRGQGWEERLPSIENDLVPEKVSCLFPPRLLQQRKQAS